MKICTYSRSVVRTRITLSLIHSPTKSLNTQKAKRSSGKRHATMKVSRKDGMGRLRAFDGLQSGLSGLPKLLPAKLLASRLFRIIFHNFQALSIKAVPKVDFVA